MDNNDSLSLVDRLRKHALEQKREPLRIEPLKATVLQCPDCGAARNKVDGLTSCAYCGGRLIKVRLSDGISITSADNTP